MVRVSVIVPVFNCEAYITDAVESVFRQHHTDLELIVVNDGSTDRTLKALEPYRDRLHLIEQPNAGVAAARNAGLRVCRGKFIAFLDADDWWSPFRLSAQLDAFERHPTAGLVLSDFTVVDADGVTLMENGIRQWYGVLRDVHSTPWSKVFSASERIAWSCIDDASDGAIAYAGHVARLLFLGNFINTSSVLVRREAVLDAGEFDTTLGTEEDYDYWLRIARDWPLAFVDAPLVARRRRPGQLTSSDQVDKVIRNVLRVVESSVGKLSRHVSRTDVRRRLGRLHRDIGITSLRAGRNVEARSHIWRSVRNQPEELVGYPLLILAFGPAGIYVRLEMYLRWLRRYLRGFGGEGG